MNKQEGIEAYMLAGLPITVTKAYNLFRTHDLRKIISRMRKKGFVISHEDIIGVDGLNNDVTYREYWLDQNAGQPMKTNYQFHPSGKKVVA